MTITKQVNLRKRQKRPKQKDAELIEDDSLLTTIDKLPEWFRENQYILRGYRKLTNSYKESFKSLFYLHNESGNVYTHLIATIIFMGIMLYTHVSLMTSVKTTTIVDHLVMAVYLVGAIICLLCSTSFHLFCCHSSDAAQQWCRIDYFGIVVLIFASFVPSIYYGYFCHAYHQAFYLLKIATLAIFTMIVTISHQYSSPSYRWLRILLFTSMGLSGVVPFMNAMWVYGFGFMRKTLAADWILIMAALYLSGAVIFAVRIPERWFPGKFDFFFHSHQIWHCLVFMAAFAQYIGLIFVFRFWHEHNPKCLLSVSDLKAIVPH